MIFLGKILLVDDDQSITRLLEHIPSADGYELKSISNSDDPSPAALSYGPNLKVLDLMMPGIDGQDVCRNLRATSKPGRTPIIFFTSVGDIEKKLAAFGSGTSDFNVKPVFPQELRVRVRALMRNGIHG